MPDNHPNLEAVATVREALETLLGKANEARSHLLVHPSDKIKCNTILLQIAQGKFTHEALAALDTISAAQVPQPLVKLKEAFEAGRKWQREMAKPQVPLPNCDICKQPQTELGALHFSPPDANGMCKKTHICLKCEAAPQVPEDGRPTEAQLWKMIAIYQERAGQTLEDTLNGKWTNPSAAPQVSGDVSPIEGMKKIRQWSENQRLPLLALKEIVVSIQANAIAAERLDSDRMREALEEIESITPDDFETGGFLCKEMPINWAELAFAKIKKLARKALASQPEVVK